MAFRKPREYKTKARALTDPKPNYVSIVKAGANQVGFRVIKVGAEEIAEMHERIKSMTANGYEIAQIVFQKGDAFPDVTDAAKWLDEGGYSYEEITHDKDSDTYVVENKTDEFAEGSIVKIATPDEVGVSVFVGKIDPEAASREDDEDEGEPRGLVVDAEPVAAKDDEPEEESRTGKGEDEGEESEKEEDGTDTSEKDGPDDEDEDESEEESEDEESEEDAEKSEQTSEDDEPDEDAARDDEVAGAIREHAEAAARFNLHDEARIKFDEFMAYFSDGTTLAQVLAEGDDGLPPGFSEAILALVVTVRNNLMAGNTSGVTTAARDFGSLVVALANTFSFSEDSERAEKAQKMIDLFTESLPQAEQEDDEQEETEAGDDAVLRAIGDLAQTVRSQQESTNAAIEEVGKRVDSLQSDLDSRVKDLEQERQERRSVDADGTEASQTGEGKTVRSQDVDRVARGSLGISESAGDPWRT